MDWKRNLSFSKPLGLYPSTCRRDPGCYPGTWQTVAGQSAPQPPWNLFLPPASSVLSGYPGSLGCPKLSQIPIISRSETLPSFHWIQGATCQSCSSIIPIRGDTRSCEGDLPLPGSICLLKEELVQMPSPGLSILHTLAHWTKPCYSPER